MSIELIPQQANKNTSTRINITKIENANGTRKYAGKIIKTDISSSGIINTEVVQPLRLNKDTILSYCRTKDPEKDKNFIQCMLGLYDMEDKMNGITSYTLRNIEPLKNGSKMDNDIKLPSFYMMEKCWDDMPMTEFYKQYDEFVSTQRSPFFFQSNLINMARTFLCYHRRCLDRYYTEGNRAIFSKKTYQILLKAICIEDLKKVKIH
jgi:hypothetical protein